MTTTDQTPRDNALIAKGLEMAAKEARRYAESYPQSSDGRNTFILLAENLERLKPVTDYVVVPREPTEAMKLAGSLEMNSFKGTGYARALAAKIYRAMIDTGKAP